MQVYGLNADAVEETMKVESRDRKYLIVAINGAMFTISMVMGCFFLASCANVRRY